MLKFVVYPLVGGFLGALMNLLVLAFLFGGKKKYGLLEKKREMVAEDLSSSLCSYFCDAGSLSELITKEKVHDVLKNVLFSTGRKVPMFAASVLSGILEHAVSNAFFEGGIIKQELLRKLVTAEEAKDFIYKKIMAFDMSELKRIVLKSVRRELLLFVFLGGFTGVLIGLAEVFLPL